MPRTRPSPRSILAVAALANLLAPLPVFLLGALAVFIRREFGLSAPQFGLAVSAFFAVSALTSVPSGRLGERTGPLRAIMLAACISACALTGLAVASAALWHLAAWMALAGVANAMLQPAANLAIARGVSMARQGIAFGIKQSTGPGAALVAGVAVPAVGLTIGWRWAFGIGACGCLVFALWVRRMAGPRAPRGAPRPHLSMGLLPMAALTLTTAFGAAALNAVAAFYVDAAVTQHGVAEGTAGLWFAFGGGMGIVGRILAGWFSDRLQGRHMIMVAGLFLAGGAGVALLAVAAHPLVRLVATLFGFAAGWGWSGVFNFVMVRQNDTAPAAATSVTNTGLFVGGMVGPSVFGLLVQRFSYETAWLVVGSWMVTAAVLVLVARKLVVVDRARRAAGGAAGGR